MAEAAALQQQPAVKHQVGPPAYTVLDVGLSFRVSGPGLAGSGDSGTGLGLSVWGWGPS